MSGVRVGTPDPLVCNGKTSSHARRSRHIGTAALAFVVPLLVVVPLLGAPAEGAPKPTPSRTAPAKKPTGTDAAIRRAAETGQSVPVPALTTETQSAVANPDGSVTMTLDATPVRVQGDNGSWTPIDTTLALSDGVLKPAAATVAMSFSDGGSTAPLATITKGSATYRLMSPWTLPVPVVSGSTATYMSVSPGVDLVVQADADGFSDNLVVEDPAAATALETDPVVFPVHTTGVSQIQDPVSGTVRQIDSGGDIVFSGDDPMMWDSTGADVPITPEGIAADVTSPSPDAQVGSMMEAATGTTTAVAPSSSMMQDRICG
jgi:hypothetical protein